jgi:LysR family transcriptional activator of dmlA
VNNDPDLGDLRVFCTVARRASFVATAAELGVSPAYVSKRIAILEARLGVRLFHRTTRRVHISDDGEAVYEAARKVLDDIAMLAEAASRAKGEPSGPLRISTSLRLGRNHVSHVLSLLERRYPKLDIWLELLDRRVNLLEEDFDVDIRIGEPTEPQLIAHRIVESSRVLCAAPSYLKRRGHPKTLAELAHHECLLFRDREQSFGHWRLQGPKGAESVKVTGRFGSNHSDVVRNWGIDGHGIFLLSIWDIAPNLKDGTAVRVLPAYREPADVWAMTSSRSSSSAKVRLCVEFLRRQLTRGAFALDTSLCE